MRGCGGTAYTADLKSAGETLGVQIPPSAPDYLYEKDIEQKNIDMINNLKNELDINKQELSKYRELYENEKNENEKISAKIRRRIYKIYKNLLKK